MATNFEEKDLPKEEAPMTDIGFDPEKINGKDEVSEDANN